MTQKEFEKLKVGDWVEGICRQPRLIIERTVSFRAKRPDGTYLQVDNAVAWTKIDAPKKARKR